MEHQDSQVIRVTEDSQEHQGSMVSTESEASQVSQELRVCKVRRAEEA